MCLCVCSRPREWMIALFIVELGVATSVKPLLLVRTLKSRTLDPIVCFRGRQILRTLSAFISILFLPIHCHN